MRLTDYGQSRMEIKTVLDRKENCMQIFITGGTGFIGRAAIAYLTGIGHELTAYVRDIDRASEQLGNDVRLVSHLASDTEIKNILENIDCVVNLAGEPLAGVRWTSKKKIRFLIEEKQ